MCIASILTPSLLHNLAHTVQAHNNFKVFLARTTGVSTNTISVYKYVSIMASSQPIRKSSRARAKSSRDLRDEEDWRVRDGVSLLASRNDDDAVEEAVASTNGDVAKQSIEAPATNKDDDEDDVFMDMESSKEPEEDDSDLVLSEDTASTNERSLESTTMEPRKKSDNSSRVDRRVETE